MAEGTEGPVDEGQGKRLGGVSEEPPGAGNSTKDSRGGGSDGKICSLPNGIRTGPVPRDGVADSRDQPNQRARSTTAGTVTTTHGRLPRIARHARSVPVPFVCEAA